MTIFVFNLQGISAFSRIPCRFILNSLFKDFCKLFKIEIMIDFKNISKLIQMYVLENL